VCICNARGHVELSTGSRSRTLALPLTVVVSEPDSGDDQAASVNQVTAHQYLFKSIRYRLVLAAPAGCGCCSRCCFGCCFGHCFRCLSVAIFSFLFLALGLHCTGAMSRQRDHKPVSKKDPDYLGWKMWAAERLLASSSRAPANCSSATFSTIGLTIWNRMKRCYTSRARWTSMRLCSTSGFRATLL